MNDKVVAYRLLSHGPIPDCLGLYEEVVSRLAAKIHFLRNR